MILHVIHTMINIIVETNPFSAVILILAILNILNSHFFKKKSFGILLSCSS